MKSSSQVVVVGPSWVGDMVMSQALYIRLSEDNPDIAIDVIAPAWSVDLLGRMPEVRRAIPLDVGHGELAIGKRRKLGRQLSRVGYDQAIVLPRSLKSALVPYFAGVPLRTGYKGEWRYGFLNDVRPFDRRVLDQTVKRFVALGARPPRGGVERIPQPALSVDAVNLAAVMAQLGLERDRRVVAMIPGAEYGPAKRWPENQFAELAMGLSAAGFQVWLLGSGKERELGDSIAQQSGGLAIKNLCGATSLIDAVDLLAAADVVVTNDSGLMHVAAAVGTHVVAIYGSSTPDFTPPLTERRSIVYRGLSCSPCFKRTCPLGTLECLESVTAREIERHVLAASRQSRPGSPNAVGSEVADAT